MERWLNIITFLLLTLFIHSCSYKVITDMYSGCSYNKISIDLDKLDNNGYHLKTNQPIDYEFCIPDNETTWNEVLTINPKLKKTASKGRAGCVKGTVLVFGNTDNKAYKSMLCKIANLDYVKEVRQTFWE